MDGMDENGDRIEGGRRVYMSRPKPPSLSLVGGLRVTMTGRGPIDAIMVRTVSFLPWSRLGYGSGLVWQVPPSQV